MVIDVQVIARDAQIKLESISAEMEAQFQVALRKVVTAAYNETKRLATERLKTTQKDYLKALRFDILGPNTYLIQLSDDDKQEHGLPPSWLEGGFAAFDMKPGMLKGPRSRAAKGGGRYNIIPFKHSPSATPTTMGQAIQQQGLKSIIREKKLSQISRDANGKPKDGIVARLNPGTKYGQMSDKTKRILGTNAKNLEGLVKVQKNYGKATQSQYFTFRVVSSKSKASSWLHPGFEGAHIFPTVERYIGQEIRKVMEGLFR